MGNILSGASKDNTRYTQFEDNQVLTSEQLNGLFRYLDIQSRLTRTRGIGVGIVCGMEIGFTAENKIVVSMGSAITTDGDLLHFSNDQAFDSFIKFEDINSRYNYFHNDQQVQIPLFQLVNKEQNLTGSKMLTDFTQEAGAALKEFIGILYLEDYNKDADLCTGADCDNKGIECVKDLKLMLVHKDQLSELLKSLPEQNKNYFSLEDIDVPRVLISKNIRKYDDLKGAFNAALNVRDNLVALLEKAYNISKLLVEDDLNSTDPVAAWQELLKKQFTNPNQLYIEYLYDYLKDLCVAYNELRESLFDGDSMCCPPVELFPKHVLLGLVKTATVRKTPAITGSILSTAVLSILRRTIRFDDGSIIRRFQPVNSETEFRHSFYESPVLKNKEEMTERILFCFKRIDSLIRNFKIPEATTDIKKVNDIRIIPSHEEDRRLGERSIPFYYNYTNSLPVNAYWSFEDNVRKKENALKYFFSGSYGLNKDFLLQNILPYSFFRIEGHIGFKYQEVEGVLNQLIDKYNLPINLVTLQVEDEPDKVPTRPWYFPELHLYEHFVRQSFVDHLEQAELVHGSITESLNEKIRTTTQPEEIVRFKNMKSNVEDSVVNFSNAKKTMMANRLVSVSNPIETEKFRSDVAQVITSATEVKRQTKDLTFSNTSVPHDFVINTDIIRKSDLIADLIGQKIKKKKEELILGNFVKLNPGLEHAGGVKAGGTFIIVYSAQDEKVVADFMLPYASIDKDIVPDPPKPSAQLPGIKVLPKINPKIIEVDTPYLRLIDNRIGDIRTKVDVFENRIGGFDFKLNGFGNKFEGLDSKVNVVDNKIAIKAAATPGITTPAGTPAIDMDARFIEMTNLFKDSETKISRLNEDISIANNKLNDHEVKFGQFNNQLITNGNKLGEFGTRVQGVEAKVGLHETGFAEINGKLAGVENRVNTSDSRFAEVNTKVAGLENRVVGNEAKVTNISGIFSALEQKVSVQATTINDINSRVATVQTKVNDQDRRVNDISTRLPATTRVGGTIGRVGPQ